MASEKTTELQLNIWKPTDNVSMSEFNENFQKIDSGIVATEQKIDNEIQQVTQQLAQTTSQITTVENKKADKEEVNAANLRIDNLVIPISPENVNVEVTDAHVSTVKNKTFSTLNNRFEEVEQDHEAVRTEFNEQFAPVTNLLTNSNFANGTTGWQAISGTLANVDGTLEYTVSALSGSNAFIYPELTLKYPHKYYIAYKIKPKYSNGVRSFVAGGYSPYNYPTANIWSRYSFVHDMSATTNLVRIFHQTGTQYAIGDTVYFDDIVFIDLDRKSVV